MGGQGRADDLRLLSIMAPRFSCTAEGLVSTLCTDMEDMTNLGDLNKDATTSWCFQYDIIGAESCEGSYIRYFNEHTPAGKVSYQQCYMANTKNGPKCQALELKRNNVKYEVVE